ncbi:hypothetical protein [Haloferax sp. Q22]|uniref:hypothetical protein n=1 Tax=Haloferax sp. (strain Q22) TaxID=1526048 RepID=UPI0012F8C9F0|nr:hypothetical protein [Haloferax sp. Q22]
MSLREAVRSYEQDLDEVRKKTEVSEDKISHCRECGEPVEDGVVLISPIKPNCVTVQCFSCGTVYDEWTANMNRNGVRPLND